MDTFSSPNSVLSPPIYPLLHHQTYEQLWSAHWKSDCNSNIQLLQATRPTFQSPQDHCHIWIYSSQIFLSGSGFFPFSFFSSFFPSFPFSFHNHLPNQKEIQETNDGICKQLNFHRRKQNSAGSEKLLYVNIVNAHSQILSWCKSTCLHLVLWGHCNLMLNTQ